MLGSTEGQKRLKNGPKPKNFIVALLGHHVPLSMGFTGANIIGLMFYSRTLSPNS